MSSNTNAPVGVDAVSTTASTSLLKRYGMIALFAVLAVLMGSKMTGALTAGPTVNSSSSAHTSGFWNSGISVSDTSATGGTPGTGAITVTWTNPTYQGVLTYSAGNYATFGATTGYNVVDANGGVLCSVSGAGAPGTTNSCTYTPTTPYAGTIHIVALATTGNNSSHDTAILAVPGTPSVAAPTVGNGTVSFAITPAAGDATAALRDIKYQVVENNTVVCTVAAPATGGATCVVNDATAGLTLGSTYNFSVVVVNAAGPSTGVAESVNVGANPSAISNAAAVVNAAKGTVTVSFTAPSSIGSSTISYSIFDADSTTALTPQTGSTTTSVVLNISQILSTGTTPTGGNTSYTGPLVIVGTNSSGGTVTALTNSVVLANVPAAPTTSGTSSYSLGTLTLPAITSASTNTLVYQLETCTSTTDATTCTAVGNPKTVVNSSATVTFTGIDAGYNYSWTATAVNASGSSAALQGDIVVAGAQAPSAPTAVAMTGFSNSSITFTWAAPKYTGGSPVTAYTVQLVTCASIVNGYCVTPTAVGTAATLSASTTTKIYTALGANNYALYIEAVNNYGSSSYGTDGLGVGSGYEAAAIGPTPTWASSGAISYDTKLVYFTWNVPSTTKGYTAASYTVYDNTTGTVLCTGTPASAGCTVAAAKVSAGDSVVLYSTDAAGVSSQSVTAPTPIAKPVSTDLSATAYDSKLGILVNITYSDANTASFSIIGVGSDGSTVSATVAPATAIKGSYLFPASALNSKITYTFSVAATNAIGSTTFVAATYPVGSASNIAVNDANAITVDATPSITSVGYAAPGSLIATWAASGSGTLVSTNTTYVGTLTSASGQTSTCNGVSANGSWSCVFTGLTANATYSFTVIAVTPLGNSVVQTTPTTAVVTGLPAAPTINAVTTYSTASANGTTLNVSWTASTNTGGLPLSSSAAYIVKAIDPYGVAVPVASGASCDALAASATHCTLSGLTAGTSYTVSVQAVNANGKSVAATQSVTTAAVPSAPTGVTAVAGPADTVNAGKGTATVTWTAPASNGSPITSYVVTALNASGSSAGTTCTVSTTITNTATCVGLTDSHVAAADVYTFHVKAVNGVGDSDSTIAGATHATDSAALTIAGGLTGTPSVHFTTTATGITVGYSVSENDTVTSFNLVVYGGTNGTVTLSEPAVTTSSGYAGNVVLPFGSNGLVTGGTYTFAVQSVNAAGTSPFGNATSALGSSSLTQVTNMVIVQKTGSNTFVTWTKPSTTNGYPVSYAITVTGPLGNIVYSTTSTTTSVTLNAAYLTGSGANTITVTSVDAFGAAASPLTSGSATVVANPVAPTASATITAVATAFSSTTGTSSVTVRYNDSAVTGFIASLDKVILLDASTMTPVNATCDNVGDGSGYANTSPCVFAGLSANKTYAVEVVASTFGGAAPATDPVFVTTASAVPNSPVVSSVTTAPLSTAYSATITWAAPTKLFGQTLTGYTVDVSTDPTNATGQVYCASVLTATSTSCTIGGLAAGTGYYAFVVANDAAGSSTLQATNSDYILGTVPNATLTGPQVFYTPAASYYPTPVSSVTVASGGYGVLAISWTPSTNVVKFEGTTHSTTTVDGIVSTAGLAVGDYVVGAGIPAGDYITAVNASTASATGSITLHAAATASAPVVLSTLAQLPVSGYTVTATGSLGQVYTCSTVAATATSCSITGAANDSYTVSVDPINALGAGSTSGTAATTGTFAGWVAPDHAVVITSATPTVVGSLTVAWNAPVFTAGAGDSSAITGYTVTAVDAAGNSYNCGTVAGTATSCTITGLGSATAYTVTIAATNAVGTGKAVASLSGVTTIKSVAAAAPVIASVAQAATT